MSKNDFGYLLDIDLEKLNKVVWDVEKKVKRLGIYTDDVDLIIKSKKESFETLLEFEIEDAARAKLERKIRNLERMNKTSWRGHAEKMVYRALSNNVMIFPVYSEKNEEIYMRSIFNKKFNDRVPAGGFDSLNIQVEEYLLGIVIVKVFETNSNLNERDIQYVSDNSSVVAEFIYLYDFESEEWNEINVNGEGKGTGNGAKKSDEEDVSYEQMYFDRLGIIEELKGLFKLNRTKYYEKFDEMRKWIAEGDSTVINPTKRVKYLKKIRRDFNEIKDLKELTFHLIYKTGKSNEIERIHEEINELDKVIGEAVTTIESIFKVDGELIDGDLSSTSVKGVPNDSIKVLKNQFESIYLVVQKRIKKMFEVDNKPKDFTKTEGYLTKYKAKGLLSPTLGQLEKRSYVSVEAGSRIYFMEMLDKKAKRAVEEHKVSAEESWLGIDKDSLLDLVKNFDEKTFPKQLLDVLGANQKGFSKTALFRKTDDISGIFERCHNNLNDGELEEEDVPSELLAELPIRID